MFLIMHEAAIRFSSSGSDKTLNKAFRAFVFTSSVPYTKRDLNTHDKKLRRITLVDEKSSKGESSKGIRSNNIDVFSIYEMPSGCRRFVGSL